MTDKVAKIRKDIDTLDDRIHDLLMERAELVLKIGAEKRASNMQVIQPDREIVMIRRLLERHKGPLPREAIVRIWRELVGAVSLLQTGIKVAVAVQDDPSGLLCWDMAKDYFSSALPMYRTGTALLALAEVREGKATFGVLPRPRDGEPGAWWRYLMNEEGEKPMRIIARLPLGDRDSGPVNPEQQALAIARLKFEPSGDDRSFIGLEIDQSISRGRIVETLKKMELEPLSLFTSPSRDGRSSMHMAEVSGYVGPLDARLTDLLLKLDSEGRKALSLGGYPTPPVYEDKATKNAAA